MNYTQNQKIEQVTESTLVLGVDIGSSEHYVRAFDYRGRELTKKYFDFQLISMDSTAFMTGLHKYA